jgi:poly(A) polymerase
VTDTDPPRAVTEADPLDLLREALGGERAWLVGGAVRDRALGRPVADLDVVLDGDPERAARTVARAARAAGGGAACFALSERFGAWRVVARDNAWQVDVERLRGDSIQADLALRDFTVNAVAEPFDGTAPLDPLGGLADLRAGRLRLAAPRAFEEDPLRVLRLARVAVELDLTPERDAIAAARESASALEHVSSERVFLELRRIVAAERAVSGIELLGDLGASAVVLPELERMRGVEQSHYHHRDVYGHTLEVLERAVALTGPARCSGNGSRSRVAESYDRSGVAGALDGHAVAVRALLAEPLADGMTRGEALRWGALLHDAAKPATRAVRPIDRRVTFFGHDALGAEIARDVLGRLRASVRLREHVAALVRHHLRLGFLVHEPQPLARGAVFEYLRACEPVEVDVTLLSVCDRLATRGSKAQRAIEAHLALARRMLGDALRWREDGQPAPLLRGDELARELGIELGPRVGELLAGLARAQYTGEVSTREQALAFARGHAPGG